MPRVRNSNRFVIAAGLYFLAGLAFVGAGAIGDRIVFYGVAAAFLGAGFLFLARGKSNDG